MDGLLNDGLMVAGGALWRQFAGFGATNKGWWWRQEEEEPIRRHNHYGNDEFPTQFPIQCCFIQPASQPGAYHHLRYDDLIEWEKGVWVLQSASSSSPCRKSFERRGKQLRRTFSKYANDIIFHLQWHSASVFVTMCKPLACTLLCSLPWKLLWWGWEIEKPEKGIEHTKKEQSTHHHNKHNINIHTFAYIRLTTHH